MLQRCPCGYFADPPSSSARLREAPGAHRQSPGPPRSSQIVPVAGGTTEGQARLQHPDGGLQVSLGEVQVAEAPWAMIGAVPRPSTVARRSASSPWRRPSVKAPSALKVSASHAWDDRASTGRPRLPVRRLHAPPQQLGRPAEVADEILGLAQANGLAPARRDRRA